MAVINGTENGETINGTPDADTIDGKGGNDTINGGEGDDIIDGGAGDDIINGGGGNDTITSSDGGDTIDGGAGNDTIVARQYNSFDGAVVVNGGIGNDTVDVALAVQNSARINLGAGDDRLILRDVPVDNLLTLGTGRDTIVLHDQDFSTFNKPIVADFLAGNTGDILELAGFLGRNTSWNPATNPFDTGYLKLTQQGADVVLTLFPQGPGSNFPKDLIVLQNVTLSQLTAANFAGFAPAIPENWQGTAGDDVKTGGGADDTLSGLGGNDTISGGLGNDTINGGDGNDILDGGLGNDTISGGLGNDIITDTWGAGTYNGDGGDDTIRIVRAQNYANGTAVINAGTGNDTVQLEMDTFDNTTVNLGAGTDRLEITQMSQVNSITLGTGRDTVYLDPLYYRSANLNVTDFATGDAGDILDLADFLAANSQWTPGTNPFTDGFLSLSQQGADTILLFDPLGSNSPQMGWLFVFQNTTLSAFTAANFSGFNPDGSVPPGETWQGTAGADTKTGSGGADILDGLGGNDTIDGAGGNDDIDGGEGDDILTGGSGNDTVDGNIGNDTIDGGTGDDILIGGAGNDTISDSSGNDTIYGNDGNDTITISRGFSQTGSDITIVAGTGNDVVTLDSYSDTGTMTVDLGAGDDILNLLRVPAGGNTFTLRAGRDTIVVGEQYFQGGLNTITDFATGAAGDVIDLAAFLQQQAFDWDPTTNPFTDGFVALEQRGANVVLVVNLQGEPSNSTFTYDLFLFQNTTVAAFTPENFAGFNPDGSPPAGIVFDGTPGDDSFNGAGGSDTLRGNDGNDTLNGLSGDDLIEGGGGNDTLDGGRGNDIVRGGPGDDYIFDGAGSNTLVGGDGNDIIEMGYLSGSLPVGQTTTILAGNGNDTVKFTGAAGQTLIADLGAGDDRIELSQWPEGLTLTLGAGADTIDLKPYLSVPGHQIVVTDFTPGAGGDRILVLEWARAFTSDPAAHYNPFSFLDLELRQVGADTHLVLRDYTVLILKNTNVGDFTIDNFDADPFAPVEPGVTLVGTAGPDNLDGTRRADTISGLGGDDGIFAGSGADIIDGGGGNDEIHAGAGNDIIKGGAGADTIFGDGGTDDIDGGDGNDIIVYSDSSDIIKGGPGYDQLDFSYITDRGLGGGAMDFDLTGFLANGTFLMGGNVVTGIEELFFFEFGTVFADRVNFDATQTVGIRFQANGGNDEILATAGDDTLLGNDGDDILRGRGGNDHLEGGFGNDLLDGGTGADFLLGEGGDDILLGGSGGDELWGGAGNDRLEGQDGNDFLYAGEGDDVLLGGAGNDFLEVTGFGPGDSVDGGTGIDTLRFTAVAGQGVNLDLQAYWTGGAARSNGSAIALAGIEHFEFTFTEFADTIHYGLNATEALDIATLGGNDTVTGSAFADTIDVGLGDNVVSGLGGADVIRALGGNNVISGGAGDDDIHGGGTLNGDGGNDHILGWTGNDIIDGGTGNDYLNGGQGDDLFLLGANAGIDTIDGSFGIDTIRAMADNVVIRWNNLVDGVSTVIVTGIEHIDANGRANVSIVGTSAGDRMVFSDAFGGPSVTISESIVIDAGGGNDVVVGSSSNDTIFGGSGDDDLDGWVGADRLHGGTGDDRYRVDNAGDLVFENAGEGIDTVFASVGHYLYANVEILRLTGTGNIFGVGNNLANQLYGNDGDNLLIAGGGNDFLSGGLGNDSLFGQDGDDEIAGGDGIDYLVGGSGNDILFGEGNADALYGEAGNDYLDAGAGFYTDILVGGDGNDVLYAISGFGDYDLLDGGAGDDTYYVDTGDDLTFEAVNGGNDTVFADIQGENAGLYLYANVENLVLLGTTAFGVGNEIDNTLVGNEWNNVLLGGAGDDILYGAGGINVLFGQEGADTFVFQGGAADIIGDFTIGEDKIDLTAFGITNFDLLKAAFVQVGDVGAIDFGDFGVIILHDVDMSQLTAGDFIL